MVGFRVTNRNLKRAVRARMAATGENYTRALRAVKGARMSLNPPHGAPFWPASSTDEARGKLRAAGWTLWDGQPLQDDLKHPDEHRHQAPDDRKFAHRHDGGSHAHDHVPADRP